MKKILLPAIGVVAALVSVAQSAAETSKSNSEGIYQSLEQIQKEETDLNNFDLYQTNDPVSFLNQLSATEVSSSPKVLSLDSIVVESYDLNRNIWVRTGKYNFFTEESAGKKESFYSIWNYTTGQWQNFPTEQWEYDQDGNLLLHIFYKGSKSVNGMDYFYKKETVYTYSEGLIQVKVLEYQKNYNSKELSPYRKEELIYDNHDNLLSRITANWDSSLMDWVLFTKNEYDYDDKGYKILDANYSWEILTNQWRGIQRMEYENDAQGRNVTQFKYIWRFDSMEWELSEKATLKYSEADTVEEKTRTYLRQDGGILVNLSKVHSLFDIKGNLLLMTSFQWDNQTTSWVNSTKMEFEYDDKSRQTMACAYIYNAAENKWMGDYRTERVFNIQENMSFNAEYKFDITTESWVPKSIEKPDYNEIGHIILSSLFEWDSDKYEWKFISNLKAWEYDYNDIRQITRKIVKQWDSEQDAWLFKEMYEYEYNAVGRQILQQHSFWMQELNSWNYSSKKIYDFDENGNYILDVLYVWDNTKKDWVLEKEYGRKYDSNGRMILNSEITGWNLGSIYWGQKTESLYNEMGRRLLLAYFNWESNLKEWVGTDKIENTYYDETLTRQEVAFKWNATEKDWQYYNRQTWYYTFDTVLEVDGTVYEIEMKIYPNPADANIKIQLPNSMQSARLELFSMGGKKMLSEMITDGEQVAIQHLTPGVYLYRLIQDQKHYTGKIIKR